jgi:uncharacterized membrane protein
MNKQLLALAVLSSLWAMPAVAPAQESGPELKVRKVTQGDYELEVFDNSTTFSQGLAINSGGAIIGQREVTNADLTIFSSEYFFTDGKQMSLLPSVEGYTNVEVQALSDTNLAVGLATRQIGNPDGSVIAIVWDTATGKTTKLPRPEDTIASHAQDITADGRRITGYATGEGRLRPCVWTWDKETEKWTPQILPTMHEHNPYAMSSRVIISPNGKVIAACCTFDLSQGVIDSSLFVWREVDGQWMRELLNDEQLHLRDINDSGMIVGSISDRLGHRQPRVIGADGKMQEIELLPGDESGEVWGINAEGIAVGFSDDPRGPVGGPEAFMWKDGKTTAINLGEGIYSVASSINDAGYITGYVEVPPADADADKSDADALSEDEEAATITLAFRSLTKLKPKPVAEAK